MQKIIIAIAAAVFAFSTSMFAPAAHAGMKGKIAVGLAIGALGVMAHHHRMERRRAMKHHYHARRKPTTTKKTKKSYVAKKKVTQPKPQYVAETIEPEDVPLPEQKVATEIVTENSSITTAALTNTDVVSNDTADVNDDEAFEDADKITTGSTKTSNETEVGSLGCKKFFPSVGMTLSVSCETSKAQ